MAHFKKPLATALGAAFLASSVVPLASASFNPFSAQQLSGGYDLPNYDKHAEGKCGEGKCGADKKADGAASLPATSGGRNGFCYSRDFARNGCGATLVWPPSTLKQCSSTGPLRGRFTPTKNWRSYV